MSCAEIKKLVNYGIQHHLLCPQDAVYVTNRILEVLKMDAYEDPGEVVAIQTPEDLENTLSALTEDALARGLIEEDSIVLRDLFDTRLMNTLMPRPSEVIRSFWHCYEKSPLEATNYYYELSCVSDYIRTYRVKRDQKWITNTEYGDIDITINLSKPEKDPKMIALAKSMPANAYPKCLLCMENEGYAGRIDHPARHNHRVIPITLNKEEWGLQYSPYVYYKEHCIVFNKRHTPMKIGHETFVKLLDFVRQFPHYFLGSNADLPIVGGSILSHDHFQGGNYEFAMAKAKAETQVIFKGFEDIRAGIVKWPMSVIRLTAKSEERMTALCDKILDTWRSYSDETVTVFANTDGEPHNTITPIARMRGNAYEMDLVLRNNLTTAAHPMGLYHPWEEYHHIKKENIGLIEVMGLAVLPARLKEEMTLLGKALVNKEDVRKKEQLSKHADWVDTLRQKYAIIDEKCVENILQKEIGIVFKEILECAGVFKRDKEGREAFLRFIDAVNER